MTGSSQYPYRTVTQRCEHCWCHNCRKTLFLVTWRIRGGRMKKRKRKNDKLATDVVSYYKYKFLWRGNKVDNFEQRKTTFKGVSCDSKCKKRPSYPLRLPVFSQSLLIAMWYVTSIWRLPVQIIGQSKRQISSLTDEYKHSSLEFPLFSFFLFPRSHKTPKRGTDIINRLVCPSHVFATFLQIHLIVSTLS